VVVFTGASAGIGLATADRLHMAGWPVVGASRRGTSPGTWQPLVMDVDNDASVASGIGGILAEHGRLDAVVARAGWGLAGSVEQSPIADAKDQVKTNIWRAVQVVRAALPTFRSFGGGWVVLVSSIGSVIGNPVPGLLQRLQVRLGGLR
jgi:NADP-dependent 3-hydroxy acid dehydrogenase YdfG